MTVKSTKDSSLAFELLATSDARFAEIDAALAD